MTKIPVSNAMFLSHPILLSRWLSPVWTDTAFWGMARQTAVGNHAGNSPAECDAVSRDSSVYGGRTSQASNQGIMTGCENGHGMGEAHEPEEHTALTGGDGKKLWLNGRSESLNDSQRQVVLLGSPARSFSPEKLGGQPVSVLRRHVSDSTPLEDDGITRQGGISYPLSGAMGILALTLCQHPAPLRLLGQWAEQVPHLYIIDWAMPERNLDYLCHCMPRVLAFFSGRGARGRFREYMRFGPEGLVEQFNASQKTVFLRRLHHRKYRWGSIIAVGYAVEKLRPET